MADPTYPASPSQPVPVAPATPTTYAPSFSGAYAPSDIHAALVNAGAPPPVATTLTAVSGAESNFGKSPVSGVNHNGTRDWGVFQVNDGAHPQYGGPAVAKLPLDQQAAIAMQIYNREGPGAWSTYKSGAYKSYLNKVGSTTPPPGGAPAAPTAPATPTGVGAALAALNAPTGQANLKSTMDNLTSTIQDQTSQQQAPPMDLQGQQAAGMSQHNQQVAAMAPQLMALTRAQGGLHGVQNAPSSMSFMGGQMIPMPGATPTPGNAPPPGTTLNSTGGLYG